MADQPKTKLRPLLVFVGIAISIIFLMLAFRGLQPGQFLDSLAEVNMFLLLVGATVYFGAVLVIAWRWQFLMQTIQKVPLSALTQIVAIGYMGNNVYPLRAGEALRVFLLRRDYGLPVTSAATTVLVERVFDGIVMLSFILIGLLRVDVQSEQIQLVARISAPIFGVAVLIFFGLAAFPGLLNALVTRIAGMLPGALAQIMLKLHHDMLSGLSGLRSPWHLIGAIITSYWTWSIEAGVYWIVMGAFGFDLSYAVALLVVGTVNLAGLIPASPGQVGVYEFFASTVLIAVGVDQDSALAYAITVHIVIWLPVTIVGFVFLLRYGLSWSAIQNVRDLGVAPIDPWKTTN